MNTESAAACALNDLICNLPEDILTDLNYAHNRFRHFIDISLGCFPHDIVKSDRDRLNEMFLRSQQSRGAPSFIGNDCVEFMAMTCNASILLCKLYILNLTFGFDENREEFINYFSEDDEVIAVLNFLSTQAI